MTELLFDGNIDDATANLSHLVNEYSQTLPDDTWPRFYTLVDTRNQLASNYLRDDPKKRRVLLIEADFLMTDEERREAERHLQNTHGEPVQMWDGNAYVLPSGIQGSYLNKKAIGKIDLIRMNDKRTRMINQMNQHGAEL